jgi:hypothetical protein
VGFNLFLCLQKGWYRDPLKNTASKT